MVAPKIFISHSVDRDNIAEVKLLWVMHDALADKGFDVLLDMARLNENVGGPWRSTLNTWIEICDAAILIFTERARDRSNWFVYESSILSWRKSSDPSFTVVPLVIPPADATELGSLKFEPQALNELQAIACCYDETNLSVSMIVEALEPLRQRLAQENVFDESKAPPAALVEARLATILKKVADEDAIKRTAARLGADLERWKPKLDRWKALARLLLQADLVEACEAVNDELLSLEPREMVQIREFLAPAWVEYRAVANIPSLAIDKDANKRLIALNAKRRETKATYLNRAKGQTEKRRWISVEVTSLGSQTAAELTETIRSSLSAMLKGDDAAKRKRLNNVDFKFPIFACVAGPEPTASDIAAVRSELAAVTFFVTTATEDPNETVSQHSGACLLQPLLVPGAEEDAYERYLTACEAIQGD